MKTFLIFFCLLISLKVYGQNRTIDSLTEILSRKDIDQVKTLLELARQNNISGNYQAALQHAEKALERATKENDSLKIVMSYRLKGAALRRMERFDEALAFASKAHAIARRNNFKSEIKFLLNTMAIIYSTKARYDRALDYHFQSLEIREAEGDQYEISVALNNIGFVYFKLKNFSKAYEYFNKSLKISKAIGETYELELLYINIGTSEVYLGDYHSAIDHFNLAFSICGEKCSDATKIEGRFGLGAAYLNLNQLEISKEYFNDSYRLALDTKNFRYQAENLLFLGRLAIKTGDYSTAERNLNDAQRIAHPYGYNQVLIDVYKELYQLHALKKDGMEKIYLKKYADLNDSLISIDIANNITMIQARFEEGQNMKSIDEQDNLVDVKKAEVEKYQIEYSIILIITVMFIALTFLIVRFNRK